MDRYISTIISKFSNILGINSQKNCVSGVAIRGFGLKSMLRALGLRLGGGSSMAVSLVAVSRVTTATAAAAHMPVHQGTRASVLHCWRPAEMVWRVSGKIDS
jgi:hypothetical protein